MLGLDYSDGVRWAFCSFRDDASLNDGFRLMVGLDNSDCVGWACCCFGDDVPGDGVWLDDGLRLDLRGQYGASGGLLTCRVGCVETSFVDVPSCLLLAVVFL